MKKRMLFLAITSVAGLLLAADSTPKDDALAAAKKLGDSASYSWKTTVAVPDSARFKPGPTDGKTEKGGFTDVKMTFGDNTMEIVTKGDKAVFMNQDGEWQTPAEAENDQGFGRFISRMVRDFKAPAAQAEELANGAKELKKDGDVISGDLTEDAAKSLMSFRRRGGNGPEISNPKGSVKFWTKDGVLSKYEFSVKGSMDFNGNTVDMDRTTTVEIKDVGSTKVEVPDAAKKKIS
ncbi:MAG TPA: hypothetical protein VFM25_00740 [Verrucomicrobiae bacterium]|jgi:hypothetical protein|nr:hypothetical protein [Verrucomicrobiae bacterium]